MVISSILQIILALWSLQTPRFDSGAAEEEGVVAIISTANLGTVLAELVGCFNLIFYQMSEEAVFKVLGVE